MQDILNSILVEKEKKDKGRGGTGRERSGGEGKEWKGGGRERKREDEGGTGKKKKGLEKQLVSSSLKIIKLNIQNNQIVNAQLSPYSNEYGI